MKIYYAIMNCGDGSNAIVFSKREFDGERMEEEDGETWGSGDGFQEGCFDVDGTVTGLDFADDDSEEDNADGGIYFADFCS